MFKNFRIKVLKLRRSYHRKQVNKILDNGGSQYDLAYHNREIDYIDNILLELEGI